MSKQQDQDILGSKFYVDTQKDMRQQEDQTQWPAVFSTLQIPVNSSQEDRDTLVAILVKNHHRVWLEKKAVDTNCYEFNHIINIQVRV